MNNHFSITHLVLVCFIVNLCYSLSAQVKVAMDTDLTTPAHPTAVLDIVSTTKGMLPPRLTTLQRNTILSPAEGLLIYNTSEGCLNEYVGGFWRTYCELRYSTICGCVEYLRGNGGGLTSWIPITSEDWRVTGNSGTNPNVNFIGTSDNQPLTVRTNSVQKWRFERNGTLSFLNTGNSVFIGASAGLNDDLASNFNTFVGTQSGTGNSSGSFNAAFGYNALSMNTTGLSNTSIGASTMLDNITGSFNVAVGIGALADNITGNSNVAIGNGCMNEKTTGNDNVAVGANSMGNLTAGADNIAIGSHAVSANGNGGGLPAAFSNVIGIGRWTYVDKTAGDFSVAVGFRSCSQESTGSYNTGIGAYSNSSNQTGRYNSAIGYSSGPSLFNLSNTSSIGYNARATSSNKVRIGNTAVTVIEGQVAYSWPSDGRFKSNIKENVPGLDFVMGLRPVTYKFDTKKFDEFILREEPDSLKAMVLDAQDYSESQQITHTGFVAQEVETLVNELDYDFDGLNTPKNDYENYSVSYSTFVVPLVKAVQEQQVIIKELQEQVDALEKLVKEK